MNEGLEALENIGFEPLCQNEDGSYWRVRDEYKEDFETIEKELKALEVIKEKKVQVRWLLKDDFLEEYNDDVEKKYRLTLSEFTLLKEVLL